MALLVHLPLTGDLHNQGLAEVTYTGTPVFKTTGKIGNSAFDLSHRVAFNCPSLDGIKTFSIAFWAKVNSDSSLSTNWVDVISFTDRKSDGSVTGGLRWETCYGGTNYTNWGISSHDNLTYNISNLSSFQAVGKDIWHHIIITVDLENNEVKEYQNGIVQKTATCNGGSLTGAFHLGENNLINGEIQDVRVYSHCLSQKKISELKKALILHFCLDGNNGTLANENLLHGSNVIGSDTTVYGWVSNGSATGMEILSDGSLHYKYNISNSKYIPSITTNTVVPCEFSKTYFYSMDLKFDKAITLSTSVPAHFWVGARNNNSITNTSCNGNLTGIQTQYISNHSGTLPANTWVHITTKFTFPAAATSSGYDYPAIRCFVYGSVLTETTTGEVNVWMKNCKVEEGHTPTPWCPNPSDALYTALGYDDGIEYDTSGYGNNGTKVGDFDYSTDSPRYLASTIFEDDCNQYIHTPYLSFLTNEITMSCWVYQTSASNTEGTNQYIMSQGRDTNGNGFSIRSNNGVPYLYMNTGSGISLSSGANILNEWHHLVATYDGSNACIYIDGQLKNSKSITGSIDYSMAQERFVVGKMSYGYTNHNHYFPFVGKISDARVYASCLSDTEIQKLYTVSASIDSNGNAYSAAYVEG